ncbi:MAG TPA: hypothetical protein VFW71_06140 [Actinomycetota bacterium]|nr:hypothetical protein [Actinomycetota bacterium]
MSTDQLPEETSIPGAFEVGGRSSLSGVSIGESRHAPRAPGSAGTVVWMVDGTVPSVGVAPQSLDWLRTEAAKFNTEPYLMTVTEQHRPHCAVVAVDWDPAEGRLIVPAPGSWTGSVASGHRQVTVLWPPAEPGGYSLIVDGLASTSSGAGDLIGVAPTRVVLHRRGAPVLPASACGSDCVPLL